MKISATAVQWAQAYLARETAEKQIAAERDKFRVRINAESDARLATFDAELAALEIRAAAECDESLFVQLAAKKDLRPHLVAKFKSENDRRLSEFTPSVELPQVSDFKLSDFLRDAEAEFRANFRQCYQNEIASDRCFNDSDSGRWFWRMHRHGNAPGEREQIISAIASNKPEKLPFLFQ